MGRNAIVVLVLLSALVSACFVSAQTWQPLKHQPAFQAGVILLLTDGAVLVHEEPLHPQNWYKLTPDVHGSYINGTWSQVASLTSGYGPHFFGSAVLPDGRVVIEGGEFNNGDHIWTNQGAIYDPVQNQWTPIMPPAGWTKIGDASATILSDGTLMQADCCDTPPMAALLDANTLTWTTTGTGKFDPYEKEGLTLLPNGQVLDVDTYKNKYLPSGVNSEAYDPTTGAWASAGGTVVQLWDSRASCNGKNQATYEIGAGVLRPGGTVFWTGANTCPGAAGHTAIYDTKTALWSAGPDFPNGLDQADGPSALEINGKVLVMASPGFRNPPSTFLEWDGSTLTQVPGPPRATVDSSFSGHLLQLPTGQLLFSDFTNDVEVFTPSGTYDKAWRPSISSWPGSVSRGHSYLVSGMQFNGLSQDAMYNDDFQDATNYPLVAIVIESTGHVFFCRTHGHSTMAVATGTELVSTHFDIPANMETGPGKLYVIANGIPSASAAVTVN